MSTPSSGNVSLSRGSIYLSRFVNNAYTGQFIHLGNCDTFSFQPSVEFAELANFMTAATAPYKKTAKKTNLDLKIGGFEFVSSVIALATFGTQTMVTQSSGSVLSGAPETLASSTLTGLKGSYFQTAKRNISNVVVKQSTTTFLVGTDYDVVDAQTGMIYIRPGGGIADGTDVHVSYDYAAITGDEAVSIADNNAVEGRCLFVPDPATGPEMEIVFWNVSLAPDGDIGLISDDYLKWGMSGSVLSDAAGVYGGSTAYKYGRVHWRT